MCYSELFPLSNIKFKQWSNLRIMKKTFISIFISVLFFSCNTKHSNSENPATVYFGGDILTMVGDEPSYVEALVVKDGLIEFAGTAAEAMKIAGSGHKMVDLAGKTLLPGFIDGHAHFANFSSQAIGAILLPSPDASVDKMEDLIATLKDWNTPENRALTGWIFGTGFDDSVLEEKRFPTKHDLDQVSTEFPIIIIHISGHFAVVNSLA